MTTDKHYLWHLAGAQYTDAEKTMHQEVYGTHLTNNYIYTEGDGGAVLFILRSGAPTTFFDEYRFPRYY